MFPIVVRKWSMKKKSYGSWASRFCLVILDIHTVTMVYRAIGNNFFHGLSWSAAKCPLLHEQLRRLKGNKTCNAIEVNSSKHLLVSMERFLRNILNKASFLILLADSLTIAGIRVEQSIEDAETLVVKTALECTTSGRVNVYADDIDILVIFLHHITSAKDTIYLTTVGKSYNLQSFSKTSTLKQMKLLHVTYIFSGCDMVSSIHQVGKVTAFEKWQEQTALMLLFRHSWIKVHSLTI